jgi:hypothetical protein
MRPTHRVGKEFRNGENETEFELRRNNENRTLTMGKLCASYAVLPYVVLSG